MKIATECTLVTIQYMAVYAITTGNNMEIEYMAIQGCRHLSHFMYCGCKFVSSMYMHICNQLNTSQCTCTVYVY